MKEIVYTTARQNLKKVIDEVVESNQPLKIVRRDYPESVVVLGESTYQRLVAKKAKSLKKDKDNAQEK